MILRHSLRQLQVRHLTTQLTRYRNVNHIPVLSTPLTHHLNSFSKNGKTKQNSQQLSINLQQVRHVITLPIIGAVGTKVIAALALKKVVIVAILKKYGLKGTFDILRTTNEQLADQKFFNQNTKTGINAALDALEMSISKMEQTEQAEIMFNWLKKVDPHLMIGFVQKYINLPESARSYLPNIPNFQSKVEVAEAVKMEDILKLIIQRVPEISNKYEVILMKKPITPQEEEEKGTNKSS